MSICADYCEPLAVVNGGVNYDLSANSMTNYPSGAIATHLCSPNFGLVGGSTRTCMDSTDATSTGSWSGAPITCPGKSLSAHVYIVQIVRISRI